MALCVDCLRREQPGWIRRYRKGSVALSVYGAGAFLLPEMPASIALQGVFFLVAFPWIVWPLVAALRPSTSPAKEYPHAGH